jgi:2-phosphosulfolactate phosphatase
MYQACFRRKNLALEAILMLSVRAFPMPCVTTIFDTDERLSIVIDTLRMTSVAATALANGCMGVLIVESVEEARTAALQVGALLGGERGALRVEGFDYGNSPREYVRECVAGRLVVLTTTNGARAVECVRRSSRKVWLASFLNAGAVAERVLTEGIGCVSIVCAGTQGLFSMEDALTTGAIVDRLGEAIQLDDFAYACVALYRTFRHDLKGALLNTRHAQRLINLGFEQDIDFCLREDAVNTVPVLGGDGWFVGL